MFRHVDTAQRVERLSARLGQIRLGQRFGITADILVVLVAGGCGNQQYRRIRPADGNTVFLSGRLATLSEDAHAGLKLQRPFDAFGFRVHAAHDERAR